MHSIRTRIILLTMAAVLVSVLAIGVIGFFNIKELGDLYSDTTMRLLCENRRRSIDEYLISIEHSVDMVSRFAIDELDGVRLVEGGTVGADGGVDGVLRAVPQDLRQAELDAYLGGYLDKVESLFRSVANHTNGVVAFYYRINPELSDTQRGFFYSKISSAAFTRTELTELSAYSSDDENHVGWYYIPLMRGRPSWLEPYYNENLGIRMISYVTPLYKAGTFIGVVGMDISYDTLISQIKDFRIFQSGFAYLAEKDGTVVYHPLIENGINVADYDPSIQDAVALLSQQDRNAEPFRYHIRGQDWQMFFGTLSSGLKLIVTAPVSEINAGWTRLIYNIVTAGILILLLFLIVTGYLMQRLTEPLQRLTAASLRLADGEYDFELEYNGRDEVGILTQTFQKLVDHLQVYISDLNSKAYQDAMTGVRNKGAYSLYVRKLDDAIRSAGTEGEPPEFALAMLDCNNLKKINDTYGHEKGDLYLKKACGLICYVFPHSPVFRVGGDEFIVILREESYQQREELLRKFEENARSINERAEHPWESVNIARGVACYEPGRDPDVESVLRRADEAMYDNKRRCKAERAD